MPPVTAKAHLRITVPQTVDGINLKYRNGKVQTSTIFLPLTAERHIKSVSAKLPAHLQYTIERVDGDTPKPQAAPTIKAPAVKKAPARRSAKPKEVSE